MKKRKPRLIVWILWIAFGFALFGCKGGPEYVIPEGSHYSGFHFWLTSSDHIGAEIQFTESCEYWFEGSDQRDYHKLFGRTYSGLLSDANSVRWCWRWTGTDVELAPYFHIDGVIMIPVMHWKTYMGEPTTLPRLSVGERVKLSFTRGRMWFTFVMEHETKGEFYGKVQSPEFVGWDGVGYLMYPYFGGNKKAPHTVKVFVDFL